MALSVTAAIASVEDGNATIKVTSNLYEENVEITKPGISIGPKEKAGEVTIQPTQIKADGPVFTIDIGKDNVCSINKLRMLVKGPNRDADLQQSAADLNLQTRANEKCM